MPTRSNKSRSPNRSSPSATRSPPIDIPDVHPSSQRAHDAHLAQAISRARSDTAQSLTAATNGSAGETSSSSPGNADSSPVRSSPPQHSSSGASAGPGSRHVHGLSVSGGHGRRPSEMLSVEEMQAAQAEQDAMFFSGNSPTAHRHRPGPMSSPSRDSAQIEGRGPASAGGVDGRQHVSANNVSPVVGRFYQNARHGSSSSVNSDTAFIDHRAQSHAMPSPSVARGPTSRRGTSALRGEVGSTPRSPPHRARGESSHADGETLKMGMNVLEGDSNDGEGMYRVHQGCPSPSAAKLSRDQRLRVQEGQLSASAGTARPSGTLLSDDMNDSALDEHDGPSLVQLKPHASVQDDFGERRAADDHYFPDASDRRPSDYPSHIGLGSRRPSDTAAVEADVCFPHLQSTPDGDLGQAVGLDLDDRYPQQQQISMPLPGVVPGYGVPFDFSVLEDFVANEKDSIGLSTDRRGVRAGRPGGISFASEDEVGSGLRRRPRLRGAGNDDGPARKLSDSNGPAPATGNRRQRKLALFEGADGDVGAASATPASAIDTATKSKDNGSTVVDFKTPLLDKSRRAASVPAYRSTVGAGVYNGGLGSVGGDARPYRFSFYSNALPATIHARSLAEIPAEGQTFEELFIGRRSDDHEHSAEMSEVGGDAEKTNASAPGTGSATPNNAGNSFVSNPNVSGIASQLGSLKAVSSLRASQSGKATPVQPSQGHFLPGMGGSNRTTSAYSKIAPKQAVLRAEEDAEANTWWLDVLCPTDAEMKVLSKVFGIHPLTTEDIQMEETREKIELFRNYYLVCFRSFDQDPYSPTYLEPLNMYIIVFREGTLSFHFRGTPHPQNVRRRIKQLKDYINVTSDWISYALIDDITDAFGPLIQSIEYEVDSVDELVLILKEAEQSDMLRRIGTCRKKVMGLLRLMGNKADVVKGLSKRCNENWSVAPKSDIGLYLSDIQDHLVTMLANLNHYEKILSRSHSNYLAQISIEMTDASNQINDVLSKLTALGSILVPMNLVTGLWGMNVHVPGQDIETGYTWFISIVCALVGFAIIGGWLTFRFFKWSN